MDQNDEKWRKTQAYFKMMLSLKGEHLSKFENGHIMMLYFFTEGLEVLGKLDEDKKKLIEEYVLSLQIPTGGWAPSSFYTQYQSNQNQFYIPHIVFTYSAINILTLTGGLSKINKEFCLQSVAKCAKQNGSYSSFSNSEEADLRFVYSAVVICHALGDFSLMNREKVVSFIQSCYNFDGGYGLRPYCQSHSGAIYCALASLKLLNVEALNPKRTLLFLVNRQAANLQDDQLIGVQGRVGKLPDSCYSFWVGASICLLTNHNLLNPKVENFINLCYKEGECSFSKYPTSQSGDPVHTLHSITGVKIARNQIEDMCLQKGIRKVAK